MLNNPGAQRLFDTLHTTINVVQDVEGVLLRITVARDAMKIISVGPIRINSILNGIRSGRFVVMK